MRNPRPLEKTGSERLGGWKKTAAVALLAAGALSACGKVEAQDPTTINPTTPIESPSETPDVIDPNERVVEVGEEFSPESIAKLSEKELSELFSIKAEDIDNPEEYAYEVVERLNGWHNAGTSNQEIESFGGLSVPKGEYARGRIERYNDPISSSIFGKPGDPGHYELSLHRHDTMYGLNKDGYEYTIDLVKDSVSVKENPDGSFDIKFRTHEYDNYDVKDVFGDVDSAEPVSYNYLWEIAGVQKDKDGRLIAAEISQSSE